MLYQRQWNKPRVIDLFVVVDWLMKLSEWLDQQVWQEIETIEESEKMQYITSVEKIGIAKGRLEGRLEENPSHLENNWSVVLVPYLHGHQTS